MFVHWAHTQRFTRNARSSIARVGWESKKLDNSSEEAKPLIFLPWNGCFFFVYGNCLLWYKSLPVNKMHHIKEQVSVSCLGRSPAIVQQLLAECQSEFLKLTRGKTSIFEPNLGFGRDKWRRMRKREIRSISTIVMDKEEKSELLEDINAFLAQRTQEWYASKGLLYKRGYLLHGPPGTGKSSLILSVAGYFHLNIYKLDVSTVQEN